MLRRQANKLNLLFFKNWKLILNRKQPDMKNNLFLNATKPASKLSSKKQVIENEKQTSPDYNFYSGKWFFCQLFKIQYRSEQRICDAL